MHPLWPHVCFFVLRLKPWHGRFFSLLVFPNLWLVWLRDCWLRCYGYNFPLNPGSVNSKHQVTKSNALSVVSVRGSKILTTSKRRNGSSWLRKTSTIDVALSFLSNRVRISLDPVYTVCASFYLADHKRQKKKKRNSEEDGLIEWHCMCEKYANHSVDGLYADYKETKEWLMSHCRSDTSKIKRETKQNSRERKKTRLMYWWLQILRQAFTLMKLCQCHLMHIFSYIFQVATTK